ncbi:MAG: hypothetical protein ACR2LM_19880 [Pyrinomonadaceae bacterium]
MKRDLDSGKHAADSSGMRRAASTLQDHSIAVLYFENLSGMKEDEYLRDGITEDITTELSKIKGLKTFSRAMVLAYRDKSVTAGQVGKELGASQVLVGSLRRAGARLRINAQLVDAATDFPLWSERYDREMKDVFEVQDEIAQKIASALRITLSPQEQQALSAKPTENLQAYDLYLREETMPVASAGRICCLRSRCMRMLSLSIRISRLLTPDWQTCAPSITITSSVSKNGSGHYCDAEGDCDWTRGAGDTVCGGVGAFRRRALRRCCGKDSDGAKPEARS